MTAERTESHSELKAACRQGAVAVAVVSGLLAACVAVLLMINHFRMQGPGPLDDPKLQQLRKRIHDQGGRQSDRQEFGELDLRLRREYFRRQRLAVNGGYLLVGAIALCVGAGIVAASLGKRIAPPVGPADLPAAAKHLAMLGRWSVGALGVLLAAAAIVSAVRYETILTDQLGFDQSQTAPPVERAYWPTAEQIAANWPRFRGPRGAGASAYDNVPETWDGKTGRGILWEAFVPLPGENSPVVWGNRVFLTGADATTREVYCYSASAGDLLWQRASRTVCRATPGVPEVSDETGYAAPTAVTDGRRVYAIFANGDLVAFDFDGRGVWGRNLGAAKNTYGYASSLAMYRNLVLVQFDQGDQEDDLSQLLAVDGATGKIAWKVRRPVSDSWATPIVANTPTGDQLITLSRPWVIAYDPATGREIWKAKCLDGDVAPSPIYAGGMVYAVEPDMTVYAIATDGRGDVTKTHVAWQAEDGAPDITSPVSDGRTLLLLTTQGMLTCYDAKTGAKLYEHELDGMFRSSPSAAAGRVYIMNTDGKTYILAAGRQFKLLGTAELGEKSNCSPAFADGRIYIRGQESLYCIANDAK